MYWVPQPVTAVGMMPAGAGFVSFNSFGQATFQQPLQVVGVLPTFTAGWSGFAGFAKGVAGVVLGGGAALNGNSSSGRSGRSKRQPKRDQKQYQNNADFANEDVEVEDWYDCEADAAEQTSTTATHESRPAVNELNKLMEQLENVEEQKLAIANISGRVLDFALDPLGCRVIQLALSVTGQKEGAELASELQGHILTLVDSKHGNYVVQKVVEVLPTSMASFVVDELKGTAIEMARHRYGCRILCRLFEHSGTEEGTADLINEILPDARELSRHAYAYHVIRSILEHGLPEHCHQIGTSLSSGAQRQAKHRHASFVIEKALAQCDERTRAILAKELLQKPENLVDLARHQFGRHVVSQLARVPGECSQKALHNLHIGLPQVQTSKHGRRLIEELKQQLAVSAAGNAGMMAEMKCGQGRAFVG